SRSIQPDRLPRGRPTSAKPATESRHDSTKVLLESGVGAGTGLPVVSAGSTSNPAAAIIATTASRLVAPAPSSSHQPTIGCGRLRRIPTTTDARPSSTMIAATGLVTDSGVATATTPRKTCTPRTSQASLSACWSWDRRAVVVRGSGSAGARGASTDMILLRPGGQCGDSHLPHYCRRISHCEISVLKNIRSIKAKFSARTGPDRWPRSGTAAARAKLAARAGVRGAVGERLPPDRRATPPARQALPAVHVQRPVEPAALTVDVDVERVERRPAGLDRLGEHVAYVAEQPASRRPGERVSGPLAVQPRPPQRLVGVDVADSG